MLHGLQKKLDEAKGKWAEELNAVVWALRRTVKAATRETLFILAYRSEAILPIEVTLHTYHLIMFQEELNLSLIHI